MAAIMMMATVSCGQRGAKITEVAQEQITEKQIEPSLEEKYAPKIAIGTEVEDFTVQTADGQKFTLSSLKGNYVILDFWASWCGDCRAEIPAVKALAEDYTPKGVKVVGFSLDNDSDAWHKCLEENGMDWLQVSNLVKWKENPIAEFYGMSWIPTMFLIDREGKIAAYAVTAAAMRTNLDAILQER